MLKKYSMWTVCVQLLVLGLFKSLVYSIIENTGQPIIIKISINCKQSMLFQRNQQLSLTFHKLANDHFGFLKMLTPKYNQGLA